MPTYICRATRLDATAMSQLAAAITTIHSEVTGADGFFAQVVFEPLDAARCFLGGRPLSGDQVFVHGHIRAGRSALDRARLIEKIVSAVAATSRIERDRVWVYVSELPPRAMAEYGVLLPEPGDEAAWFAALPETTRRRLASDDGAA